MRRIILLLLLIALTGCTFSVADLFELVPTEPDSVVPTPATNGVRPVPNIRPDILAATYTMTIDTLEITFMYPEGWYISDENQGSIIITNIADVEAVTALESGHIAFVLTPISIELVNGIDVSSPKAMAEIMVQTFIIEGAMDAGVEIISTTVNDRKAAKVHTQAPFLGNDTADVVMLIIEQPSAYMVIIGIAPLGEMNRHDALLDDIAASIHITEVGTD